MVPLGRRALKIQPHNKQRLEVIDQRGKVNKYLDLINMRKQFHLCRIRSQPSTKQEGNYISEWLKNAIHERQTLNQDMLCHFFPRGIFLIALIS